MKRVYGRAPPAERSVFSLGALEPAGEFGMMPSENDGLSPRGCGGLRGPAPLREHVGYWKPVWHILEGQFTLVCQRGHNAHKNDIDRIRDGLRVASGEQVVVAALSR